MKKIIIQLNERIIAAIYSLRETMARNQRFPNLEPSFIESCSKWYREEGEQIKLTLRILKVLCLFSKEIKINKKTYQSTLSATKKLQKINKNGDNDYKKIDKDEKVVYKLLKDFPNNGIITYKI